MEEELLSLLRSAPSVLAVVSAGSIRFGIAPQGLTAPYVVLHVVTGLNDLHMNGVTDITSYRVQVDVRADKPLTAKRIDRAIQTVLHGYRGGGFDLIMDDTVRDMGYETTGVQDEKLYRVSHDFIIHWRN